MMRYDKQYEANQMKQIDIKDLKCPLLKQDCIGDKCMWWLYKGDITRKCAITRLATRI